MGLHCYTSYILTRHIFAHRGVNPGGWGSRPPDFWQEVVGLQEGRGGSWTGREILIYLIMNRKYVRKW